MARPKSVAVWIRNNRQANEWTQLMLAKRMGYQTSAMVCNWETNAKQPGPDQMKRLEELFGRFDARKSDEVLSDIDEGTEFGLWVREARKANDLTLAQLSERSGVNIATISQIENGKIASPQARTRERLVQAFSDPTDTAPEEEFEEVAIKGLGNFAQFNPWVEDEWPSVAGVYVFYDIANRVTYVGRGQDIRSRVKYHHDQARWFIKPFVVQAAYIPVSDGTLQIGLERILIKFLLTHAMVNKMEVER